MSVKKTNLPDLVIGDLRINPPIIQGGMGVRVSAERLASSVSNEGALGVIASVGTGEEWPDRSIDYVTRSSDSLRHMIREAKRLSKNPIAVNIMCALTNYDSLVKVVDEEDIVAIISGAGLPLKLPALVRRRSLNLIPIVSSGRAAELLCKTWLKRYGRLPDAFVVEGPLAGGHLGFKMQDLRGQDLSLEQIVEDVLAVVSCVAEERGVSIPVIAAGGIFDGKDIAHFLALGASGVQMGTRFVCTHECDVAHAYKEAYINCHREGILLIESPVKLPLRVIRNNFVDRILAGEKMHFDCPYRCLVTCEPEQVMYCIAQALVNAYRGNLDHGFATCGANAYRSNRIVSVSELIQEIVSEAEKHYASSSPAAGPDQQSP